MSAEISAAERAGPDDPAVRDGQEGADPSAQHRPWAYVLFLLPVAAVVVPAIYNREQPRLAGVPFFIWYQFALVIAGGMITGAVYLLRGTQSALAARQSHDSPGATVQDRAGEPTSGHEP